LKTGPAMIAACLGVLLSGASRPQPARPTPELVSIVGLKLKPGEYVDGFQIRTQGVDILSACHIPFGWHVRLGIYDSVEGDMTGEAGLGPSFVSDANHSRGQLENLFLVRTDRETARWDGQLPPTYRLRVSVGRYGRIGQSRWRSLSWANLRRTPAARCPPPSA
jgi:hypothetical protein